MKIGIGRFWHEANSFAPTPVGRAEFEAREWVYGDACEDEFSGSATEPGGAIQWAAENGAELIFSRCASAPPGGPIEQKLLNEIIEEIATDPVFDDVDGIYLSLHGSSLGTQERMPEERLVRRMRGRFPEVPIVVSFDMHACPTQALTDAINGVTVFRKYPHIDMAETGVAAVEMLARMIHQNVRPKVIRRVIDKILPSFRMRTDAGLPMFEIEEIAIAESTANDIWGVYPFASFSYADTESANAGALVTCTNDDIGSRVAETVAAAMSKRRGHFQPGLESAADVLAGRPWEKGRVAVLEPSDNPMSGGGADTPGLLAAALQCDLPQGSVFAFFHDPDLVKRAQNAGVGAILDARFGARHGDLYGQRVSLNVEVGALTDGSFIIAGPMEHGRPMRLGPTALLKAGPLSIIVTSVCQSPNDVNYFALHHIDLLETPLLLAKAKNHFMAALGPYFDSVIQADTPGPAMADVSQLPFKHVPRHFFDLT